MSKLLQGPKSQILSQLKHALWEFLNNESCPQKLGEKKGSKGAGGRAPVSQRLRPADPQTSKEQRGPKGGFSLLLVFAFAFVLAFVYVLSFCSFLRRHLGFFRGPAVLVFSPGPPRLGSVSKATSTPNA